MYSCYSKLCNVGTSFKDELELKYIPTSELSHELCMKAVCQNGLAIKDVPEKFHTPQLYLEAVKQNVITLEHVEQTQSLCDVTVELDGLAIKYVEDAYKTADLCKKAVQNNPFAIRWTNQSPDLCLMAVQGNSEAIIHIKDEYKTKDICDAVVASPFVGAGKYLPDDFKSKFDEFYNKKGYTTFGPIKIYMKRCIHTYPCKHHAILEDGSSSVLSAITILRILQEHDITHPHFDKYNDE